MTTTSVVPLSTAATSMATGTTSLNTIATSLVTATTSMATSATSSDSTTNSPTPKAANGDKSEPNIPLIAGLSAVGVLTLIVLVALLIILCRRRRKSRQTKGNGEKMLVLEEGAKAKANATSKKSAAAAGVVADENDKEDSSIIVPSDRDLETSPPNQRTSADRLKSTSPTKATAETTVSKTAPSVSMIKSGTSIAPEAKSLRSVSLRTDGGKSSTRSASDTKGVASNQSSCREQSIKEKKSLIIAGALSKILRVSEAEQQKKKRCNFVVGKKK